MTPEERAGAITAGWLSVEIAAESTDPKANLRRVHVGGDMVPAVAGLIADAIRAAVNDALERAAKVADDLDAAYDDAYFGADVIAEKIRALKEPSGNTRAG